MPPQDPQLVFCHNCEEEWWKDEGGLSCPSCHSEVVEIIEEESDPRSDHTHDHPFPDHPLHDHNPWQDAPDPDEGDISHVHWTGPDGNRMAFTSINRTGSPFGQMPPLPDAFGSLLGSFMGGFPPNRPTGEGGARTSGMPGHINTSYSVTIRDGSGTRYTRTSGTLGDPGSEDLTGIFGDIFRIMRPPGQQTNAPNDGTRANAHPPPGINPFFQMLMEMAGPPGGRRGDGVYTQEAFDQIMTMLREQHGGGTGPAAASEAAIDALAKIKLGKEQLDEQGKADCPICMDSVEVGAEVTELPCKHWFHGDCVKSWLKEHDSCPQCRRGIMPQDGNQNQPRATGQAPRHWQPTESDLETILGGTRNSQSREGNSSEGTTTAPQPSSSAGPSSPSSRREQGSRGLGNLAGSIFRRFGGGGGSGGSDGVGGNSGTGSQH